MFKITKDGATVAMTEAPNYIKQAENGCFVLCPEAEATGIAHNGTVYHLLGRPDMAGAEITRPRGASIYRYGSERRCYMNINSTCFLVYLKNLIQSIYLTPCSFKKSIISVLYLYSSV